MKTIPSNLSDLQLIKNRIVSSVHLWKGNFYNIQRINPYFEGIFLLCSHKYLLLSINMKKIFLATLVNRSVE